MAPTSTAPAGAPTTTGFAGDEFSNNLFSDLAPLLTLFGEQVTKQFLSMSMGWADNVLLAMGPLGIMTVIVSAIRVGGLKKLKSVIGRARESRPSAEVELLSSTSGDVCEMWNGNEIVRTIGKPEGMKELVVLDYPIRRYDETGKPEELRILDLRQAVEQEVFEINPSIGPEELQRLTDEPPNITLNVKGSTASNSELWAWAVVGIVMQAGALAIPALTVYHWKWQKGGNQAAGYGYPCFLFGTIAVIVGMILCSHVIEGSTREREFKAAEYRRDNVRHILRLQRHCTVSEQHFSSFAIFNELGEFTIRTSRLENRDYLSVVAAIATFVAVIGFVVQFVGLRALHWSATIIQLGVTLLMTAARAWVRRGLASDPIYVEIEKDHELSWLALWVTAEDTRADAASNRPPGDRFATSLGWELYTGFHISGKDEDLRTMLVEYRQPVKAPALELPDDVFNSLQPISFDGPSQSDLSVQLHVQLSKSMGGATPWSRWTTSICLAIESVMQYLTRRHDATTGPILAGYFDPITWTVDIILRQRLQTGYFGPTAEKTNLTFAVKQARDAERESKDATSQSRWTADSAQIHGILSLWIYTMEMQKKAVADSINSMELALRRHAASDNQDLLRAEHGELALEYLRIIEPCPVEIRTKHVTQPPETRLVNWIENSIIALGSSRSSPRVIYQSEAVQSFHAFPVFGMQMSSQFQTDPHKEDTATALKEPGFRDFATWSSRSLYQECASEIFTLFMLAVASKIPWLGGTTEEKLLAGEEFGRRRMLSFGSDNTTWTPVNRVESSVFVNSTITSLANCVVTAGLADSIANANVLIIPALHRYGLLPTKLGPNPRPENMMNGDDTTLDPTSTFSAPSNGSRDDAAETRIITDPENDHSSPSISPGPTCSRSLLRCSVREPK